MREGNKLDCFWNCQEKAFSGTWKSRKAEKADEEKQKEKQKTDTT